MAIESVCVLGGSGFVGTALVSELAARGLRVRVLSRRREAAKALILLPGVEVVEADVHDEAALARQFAGCDAVINLVGILHESAPGRGDGPGAAPGGFQRAHVDLPRKVVEACTRSGVERLLHMSALGADPASRSAYQRSKGLGEALVRAAGNGQMGVSRGLKVTIFRPSVIFGPVDSFLNLFARLMLPLPVIPLVCPQARFQPVYVQDVARAFADSLAEPGSFGQTYELCGPRVYTLLELMHFLEHALGIRRVIIPLNDRLSYWNARLLEMKPGAKLMTRDNYYAMQVPNVCGGAHPAPPQWQPAALEAVAPAWLQHASQRECYGGFRHRAGR
jgi:NADH dehydrogenase